MSIPSDRKYASTHEWIKADGDVMLVGITGPAQEQLGDLVFVGDVRVGTKLAAGATAGVVESVKAASDIYAPVAGEVVAFNDALNDAPETINASPYNTWIFKLKANNAADVDNLLDASHLAYVHKDSLADPDLLEVPPELSVEGDTLEIRRWIPDYRPSPFYRRVLGDDLPSVRWQHTRFLLPAIVVNEGRVAPEGSVSRWPEPDTGRGGYFINVVTPVTPTSCHYFFSYVRNWETADADLTAAISAQLRRIIDEDVALVEAQQLAQQSTPDLKPVFLGVDSGVRHARRLIERHAVSFRSTQLP